MQKIGFIACLLMWCISASAFDAGQELIIVKGTATAASPADTDAWRVDYRLAPLSWQYDTLDWLFDWSATHLHTSNGLPNSVINTYAAAPVLRWFFAGRNATVLPFLELSVGGAYLSNLYFGGRDLGIHFAFQDMAGLGVAYSQFYLMIEAVHYSNASIAEHNSGISLPVMIALGYRF